MSPYAYVGGDPMNFIDPYGLWSLGLGVVVGYDKHGWHIGGGAAFDVGTENWGVDLNASHTWSQDGSETTTYAAGGAVQFGVAGVSAGASYRDNTEDGTTVNAHVGANAAGVGAEIGMNQAWDKNGKYLGGNVYGEGYLGAKGIASIGVGYESGWGQFRSGWYQNASLALNNWSNHGDGWGYDGFQANVSVYSYDSKDYVDNPQNTEGSRPGGDDNHFQDNNGSASGTWFGSGRNLFGSWFVGPKNPKGDASFTSDIDMAAYDHDNRYGASGAAGIPGALFGRQSGVMHADRRLAMASWSAFLNYSMGGGNRMVNSPVTLQTYAGSFFVASAFTVINNSKMRY